jgi:hypothetical protein
MVKIFKVSVKVLFITFFVLLVLSSCTPKSKTTNVILEVRKPSEDVKVGDVVQFKLDASPKFGTIDGEIKINGVTLYSSSTLPISATWTATKRGFYTVTGVVKSHAFGEEEKSFQFMVFDSTPPEIKRLEIFPQRPEPNQFPLNVYLDIKEDETDNLNISVYIDDDIYDFSSSKFSKPPFIIPIEKSLQEGTHVLRTVVENEDGLISSTSTRFKVTPKDTVIPYISMNIPDVVNTEDGNLVSVAQISDFESGIKILKIFVDSATKIVQEFNEPWIGNYSIAISLPSTEVGNHSVEIEVKDDYGNPARSVYVYKVVGKSSFNVELLTEGELKVGNIITLKATHDSIYPISSATFTVDGVIISQPENQAFMAQWKAIGGVHSIGVTLKNSKGQVGSDIIVLSVEDDMGPKFALINPTIDATNNHIEVASNTSFLVEVVATDTADGMVPDGEANVLIYDENMNMVPVLILVEKVPLDDYGYTCKFSGVVPGLDSGNYTMQISVSDNSRNESTQFYPLIVK